ncbi:MAG: TIGR03088 family PEP-CTERM/XrtA system glycosyltransferase [Gammaproteobacteria bacterium]
MQHMESREPLVAHIVLRLAVGGLENGLVNLINHMPAGRYRHAIICLKSYSDFSERLRDHDIPIFALHKRDGKDLGLYLRLWRLLRRLRPDIVHTRNLAALDSVLPAALAGVRHRVHGEHGRDMFDLDGHNRRYNLLRQVCSPLIGCYVTVSRDLETWLKSRIGISGERVVQIYNGVDTSKFYPVDGDRTTLPVANFASQDQVVIGTVSRMQEVKDPLTLVRSFLHLLDSVPHARERLRLVMVGDGPLLGAARDLLEAGGAAQLAWLPGARDDIAQILRGFDVFVLPSLNEGISNTILEAMASGLPVIATDVGGNPELVVSEKSGMLVPAADPLAVARVITNYLDNPQLRKRHGHFNRHQIEQRFGLATMVERYLCVYDSVMSSGKGNLQCVES